MRQWPLQRFGLIPRRTHPDVAFFRRCQDHGHGLGMNRLDNCVRRRRQEAIDQVRAGDRLRLGAAITLEFSPDPAEGEQRSVIIEREPHHVLLFGLWFGSGAYSAKLFAGTRQRFSGFSQPRQCGDDVFLMFVTGGPPVRGGGGMPQRIMVSSRSAPALRTTGAG
jgi:hypothetical protein